MATEIQQIFETVPRDVYCSVRGFQIMDWSPIDD